MCGSCGLAGPGSDLLFRAWWRSTIGAEGFHGRVRDGIGCLAPRYGHQACPCDICARTSGEQGSLSCERQCLWMRGRVCMDPRPCFRRDKLAGTAAADRQPGLAAARGRRAAEGCSAAASSAGRAISTGQLRGLPRFHLRPIDVVVFHGSRARPGFEEGFPLRCVQRLSRPHLATRRCGWHHNRYTRGASLPVLSY